MSSILKIVNTLKKLRLEECSRDLVFYYRRGELWTLPANLCVADDISFDDLTNICSTIVQNKELADSYFNLHLRIEQMPGKIIGSNAVAFYTRKRPASIRFLIRGTGYCHDLSEETQHARSPVVSTVLIWLFDERGLSVFAANDVQQEKRFDLGKVVCCSREGSCLAVASGDAVSVIESVRECEIKTGLWRFADAEALWAEFLRISKNQVFTPKIIQTLKDDDMPAVGVLLIGIKKDPWSTIEVLANENRLQAIDILISQWSAGDDEYQKAHYARIFWLLKTGHRPKAIAFLEHARVEEWPYLFQINNYLSNMPNLFELAGLYEKAIWCYRRFFWNTEMHEAISSYTIAQIARDISRCALRLGRIEEAWDALAQGQLIDFESMESFLDYAGFLSEIGNSVEALHWLRWAIVCVEAPVKQPVMLAELTEKGMNREEIQNRIAQHQFTALQKLDKEEILFAPLTEIEKKEYRNFCKIQSEIRALCRLGEELLNTEKYEEAVMQFDIALARMNKMQKFEWRGLIHGAAAARADALISIGKPEDALGMLVIVSQNIQGCTQTFAYEYAHCLILLKRKSEAHAWARRAFAANEWDELSSDILTETDIDAIN